MLLRDSIDDTGLPCLKDVRAISIAGLSAVALELAGSIPDGRAIHFGASPSNTPRGVRQSPVTFQTVQNCSSQVRHTYQLGNMA
jgi:hypothetical protein